MKTRIISILILVTATICLAGCEEESDAEDTERGAKNRKFNRWLFICPTK